ncbi:hypothetical protein MYX06_02135 [Patescibacteria group bacterium AH-259-L05]|nr:hypothetical protein [Patescibacteria group bacterium AH-259-L05]
MEQYEIDPSVSYENIRKALDHFTPTRIFIRWTKDSMGQKTVVREDLKDKALDILETDDGLSIVIDGKEVFLYNISCDRDKKTAIAYFRDIGTVLPTGINPDDKTLPPVKESMIRGANDTHLMEITFEGKIPLCVHSPKNKDRWWDLWEIEA